MNEKILIVDDEQNVLNSLKRLFKYQQYDVVTTISANEALSIVSKEHFPVVLSDTSMPEMDGEKFLEKVAEVSPTSVRLMLGAYNDFNQIIPSLNYGLIHRFISKPWNDELLMTNIKAAYEFYDDSHKTNDELNNLPNHKSLLEHLTQLCEYKPDNDKSISLLLLTISNTADLSLTLGTQHYDKVIKEIRNIIFTTHNCEYFTARYNSHTFAILLPSIQNTSEVIQLAHKLKASFQDSIIIEAQAVKPTIHIGASFSPINGTSPYDLANAAEQALIQNKHINTDKFLL